MNISPSFIAGLRANLAFWQKATSQLTHSDPLIYQREQENIIQAVRLGFLVPATRDEAVALAVNVSFLAERTGSWLAWLPLFEHLVCTLPANHPAAFQLFKRQGQLLRLARRFEEAVAAHREAERIAHQHGREEEIADVYINLCDDYRQMEAYPAAETYGQKALAQLRPRPQTEHLQSVVLLTLGLVAKETKQLDLAEDRLRQAEVLNQAGDYDRVHRARILNALAIVRQTNQKKDDALATYQEALAVLEPTVHELDKCRITNSLGTLYFDLENYEAAVRAFMAADTEALWQSGDLFTQAALTQNLGNALTRLGRYDEALLYLQRSRRLWQRLDNWYWLANTIGIIAEGLAAQTLWKSAVNYYTAALAVLAPYTHIQRACALQEKFSEACQVARGKFAD